MQDRKWKKLKQNLSNTPRLTFLYLKIIGVFYPRYHPKVIGDFLKNVQKTNATGLMSLCDKWQSNCGWK